MRTKLLLSAAVLGVAGVIAASAQVYSVNVVGYINVPVPAGFSMIANQLNASPDNTLATLMPNPPEGTTIYKFLPATGEYDISGFEFGEWSQPGMTLNPGEGAFINASTAFTALFVGEVTQGELTTPLVAGFQIVASQVPQSAALDTELGFPAAEGDIVYRFDNATGEYAISGYEFGEWSVVPVPNVGEAFFVSKAAAGNWVRNFSVQ
jgi:hypothetical protein